MTDEDLRDLLAAGVERRHLEFKGPRMRTHKGHLAEVAKACLGMANTRYGGVVIVGVDRKGEVVGLDDTMAESWSDQEIIQEAIGAFANPWISLKSRIHGLDAAGGVRKTVAVIEVEQFESSPVFCRKRGHDGRSVLILKLGRLYVRALEKVATVEVTTPEQMRELLELGMEQRLRAFVATAKKAGVELASAGPGDADKFNAEIEGFRRGE